MTGSAIHLTDAVITGLVPVIHVLPSFFRQTETWMAGTSPAMTSERVSLHSSQGRAAYGFKISFCTRQFRSSATYSVFSDGHAIA